MNFVSTDQYSDGEFIAGLEKFRVLHPYGITIVDTFGMIKRKAFTRLVMLADNNLDEDVVLCYHAHNNLQQAFENAQTMVEMNLRRDISIDACVFGMGRGAGNLNLELFAGFMNDNYGTNYQIAPMLEIMDEYLESFYHDKFWGYSLPLYLSASFACHPNYAIFLAGKQTLSARALREILQSISEEDKIIFNYPLSSFKSDRFSKDIYSVRSDFEQDDDGRFLRCLQALLLSQWRQKIFSDNKIFAKPVVLFKSKTIKESQKFKEYFYMFYLI